MGRLVSEDLQLSSLANDAEWRMVEAFRDGLTDGWLILRDVGLRARRDHQLDVVLVHEDWGVVCIEVNGHLMQVCEGSGASPAVGSTSFESTIASSATLVGLVLTAVRIA